MRAILIGITLSLVIGAVGPADALAQCEEPRGLGASTVEQRAARRALLESGYRLATSRDSLMQRFGPPLTERLTVAPYSQQAQPDSLWRLTYSSFFVQFVKPLGASNEVAYLAELFRTDSTVVPSLHIGMTRSDVLTRFGSEAAVSTRGDTVRLCMLISAEDEAEEFAVFEFLQNALARIQWLFYWG